MYMALAQWPQPQAAQLLQLGLGEELIGVHRSVVPWPETSASYSIQWLLRLIHCALTLRHGSTPGLRRLKKGRWFQDVPRCSKWMGARFGCVLVATLNTRMHRCWHQMNSCLRPYPKAHSGEAADCGSGVKYWANFLSNPKLWQSLKHAWLTRTWSFPLIGHTCTVVFCLWLFVDWLCIYRWNTHVCCFNRFQHVFIGALDRLSKSNMLW